MAPTTALGLGDIYQRGLDAAEACAHATFYACDGCGEERRGDCDWYEHDGGDYCEDCYLQITNSEEERSC